MNRYKKINKISIILSSMLIFGCSGGGNSTESLDTTYSEYLSIEGNIYDGFIYNANVDVFRVSDNDLLVSGKSSAISIGDYSFNFKSPNDNSEYKLTITNGFDTGIDSIVNSNDTSNSGIFESRFIMDSNSKKVYSNFTTTIVSKIVEISDLNLEQSQILVKNIFGLESYDSNFNALNPKNSFNSIKSSNFIGYIFNILPIENSSKIELIAKYIIYKNSTLIKLNEGSISSKVDFSIEDIFRYALDIGYIIDNNLISKISTYNLELSDLLIDTIDSFKPLELSENIDIVETLANDIRYKAIYQSLLDGKNINNFNLMSTMSLDVYRYLLTYDGLDSLDITTAKYLLDILASKSNLESLEPFIYISKELKDISLNSNLISNSIFREVLNRINIFDSELLYRYDTLNIADFSSISSRVSSFENSKESNIIDLVSLILIYELEESSIDLDFIINNVLISEVVSRLNSSNIDSIALELKLEFDSRDSISDSNNELNSKPVPRFSKLNYCYEVNKDISEKFLFDYTNSDSTYTFEWNSNNSIDTKKSEVDFEADSSCIEIIEVENSENEIELINTTKDSIIFRPYEDSHTILTKDLNYTLLKDESDIIKLEYEDESSEIVSFSGTIELGYKDEQISLLKEDTLDRVNLGNEISISHSQGEILITISPFNTLEVVSNSCDTNIREDYFVDPDAIDGLNFNSDTSTLTGIATDILSYKASIGATNSEGSTVVDIEVEINNSCIEEALIVPQDGIPQIPTSAIPTEDGVLPTF